MELLEDGGTDVRITLNTAPLRRGGWVPVVPSPQHVAFTTDDVIASARAMRALGAPVHRGRRLTTPRDAQPPDDQRHDYSLAHLTALSLSPPELVDAAADTGYRHVGRVVPLRPRLRRSARRAVDQ